MLLHSITTAILVVVAAIIAGVGQAAETDTTDTVLDNHYKARLFENEDLECTYDHYSFTTSAADLESYTCYLKKGCGFSYLQEIQCDGDTISMEVLSKEDLVEETKFSLTKLCNKQIKSRDKFCEKQIDINNKYWKKQNESRNKVWEKQIESRTKLHHIELCESIDSLTKRYEKEKKEIQESNEKEKKDIQESNEKEKKELKESNEKEKKEIQESNEKENKKLKAKYDKMVLIMTAILVSFQPKAEVPTVSVTVTRKLVLEGGLGGEYGYIQGTMEKTECLPSSYLVSFLQYDNDDEGAGPRILYKETENSKVREIYCSDDRSNEGRVVSIACSQAEWAEHEANKEFQDGLSQKIIDDHLPMTAAIKKNKPKATTNNKGWTTIGGDMSVWANPSDTVVYLKDNISGVVKATSCFARLNTVVASNNCSIQERLKHIYGIDKGTNCKSYKPLDAADFDEPECSILELLYHEEAILGKKEALKDIEEQCALPIALQKDPIDTTIKLPIQEQLDTIQNDVEEIGAKVAGGAFHEKEGVFYKALFGHSFTCPAYDNKSSCHPNDRARVAVLKALVEEISDSIQANMEAFGMKIKVEGSSGEKHMKIAGEKGGGGEKHNNTFYDKVALYLNEAQKVWPVIVIIQTYMIHRFYRFLH